MKPKVRARLTSFRNEVVEKSMDARCERRLKTGWLNSISKFTLKPSKGSNCAHLSPSSTRSRFFTRMKRFGRRCSSMPADCSRNTKGPAAVHDRHFRGGELHDRVVDAESRERRQQVLDRRDARLAPAE